MSKSLGNFFTIRDVLARYDGETLRFFMLRTHYRSPFNFSDAQPRRRAQCAAPPVHRARRRCDVPDTPVDWAQPQAAAFRAAMNDDFNTPLAVSVLFELAGELNRTRSLQTAALLKGLGKVLGVLQQSPRSYLQGGNALDEARIQQLIDARAQAKKARDFARGRPHPRRTGRAGRGAEGQRRRHHLGQGLSMADGAPMPPAPASRPTTGTKPASTWRGATA